MSNNLIFQTSTMTLTKRNGIILAQHLPCQLDTVNIPWNVENGAIPTDWYDLYSLGWRTPVPGRSDYFIDEKSDEKYSVFGKTAIYVSHLECRVTRYGGNTP